MELNKKILLITGGLHKNSTSALACRNLEYTKRIDFPKNYYELGKSL